MSQGDGSGRLNSMVDDGRSDENAGVGARGLDNSYDTVKSGQNGGDAEVGATGLVNSGDKSDAERSDKLVVMGPVNTGMMADIGWPNSSIGAVEVLVQDGDGTGTLGKSGGFLLRTIRA